MRLGEPALLRSRTDPHGECERRFLGSDRPGKFRERHRGATVCSNVETEFVMAAPDVVAEPARLDGRGPEIVAFLR